MQNEEQMFSLAKTAQQQAYAPYSQFFVGCALKTINGKYYSGCNVENASFGLANCAESSAISQMILNGERIISEVLIVGSGEKLCPPCGACRQRLSEFANQETIVHLANAHGIQKSILLTELLPFAFGPTNVKGKIV